MCIYLHIYINILKWNRLQVVTVQLFWVMRPCHWVFLNISQTHSACIFKVKQSQTSGVSSNNITNSHNILQACWASLGSQMWNMGCPIHPDTIYMGHSVTQAVGHCPLTTEVQVQPQTSLYGITDRQCSTRRGSSPSALVFPCQYHTTNTSYPFSHLPTIPYKKGKVHPCTGTVALYRPYSL